MRMPLQTMRRTMVKPSRRFFRLLESDNYRSSYSKANKKLKLHLKTKYAYLIINYD